MFVSQKFYEYITSRIFVNTPKYNCTYSNKVNGNINYFNDLFESILEIRFRKIVLIILLAQNDADLLSDSGFLKNDVHRLSLEFKTVLMEEIEEYLDHIKIEEESIIEGILNKQMEQYFAVMLEDVRHERLSIMLLSMTDPNILKQVIFTDIETNFVRNLALEKLPR